MRADISSALTQVPAAIRSHLEGPSGPPLEFLDGNLPVEETARHLSSASPNFMGGTINSVLVITDRRLIFVAPAPQVISWRLGDITKVVGTSDDEQVGIFRVETDGSVFNLGAPGPWASTFADHVRSAGAVATLVYG